MFNTSRVWKLINCSNIMLISFCKDYIAPLAKKNGTLCSLHFKWDSSRQLWCLSSSGLGSILMRSAWSLHVGSIKQHKDRPFSPISQQHIENLKQVLDAEPGGWKARTRRTLLSLTKSLNPKVTYPCLNGSKRHHISFSVEIYYFPKLTYSLVIEKHKMFNIVTF